MAPDDRPASGGDDDRTRRRLEAALDSATNDSVRFHIRQALQHHLIATGEATVDTPAETDTAAETDTDAGADPDADAGADD